jgi:hypothetical protein
VGRAFVSDRQSQNGRRAAFDIIEQFLVVIVSHRGNRCGGKMTAQRKTRTSDLPIASTVIRFPRRAAVVWIIRENATEVLVVVGEHGWLFSDYRAALSDALWLSENFGYPIRRAAP